METSRQADSAFYVYKLKSFMSRGGSSFAVIGSSKQVTDLSCYMLSYSLSWGADTMGESKSMKCLCNLKCSIVGILRIRDDFYPQSWATTHAGAFY